MRRTLLIAIILFIFVLTPSTAYAQGMMGSWDSSPSPAISDDHTAKEEAEGKEIWEKIQEKQLGCKNLTDDNYGSLGEYFMGQMAGSSHEAMNNMMTQMMGEEGEEQMHIVIGKRLSGCDTSAQFPQSGTGFMPMMFLLRQGFGGQGMMGSTGSPQVGGGGNSMMGTGWGNMMGGWNGFGLFGWFSMIVFWLLLILGVIALIRYLSGSGKSSDESKSPLDILKERYARGEIDKKEFEEIRKDLR